MTDQAEAVFAHVKSLQHPAFVQAPVASLLLAACADALHRGLPLLSSLLKLTQRLPVLQLTLHRAQDFYQEHKGKPFFDTLMEFMTSGPIYALVLAKPDAIKSWRALMGPTNSHTARLESPKRCSYTNAILHQQASVLTLL